MKIGYINNVSFKANKMPLNEAQYLNNRLLGAKSIDIFCHVSTDEDGFSSAKIMYDYLTSKGKNPRILCSDKKENLGFDKNRYNIVTYENFPENINKADIALCLDFSQKERIRGGAIEYLEGFDDDDILCMDHHHSKYPITNNFILLEKPLEGAPDIKNPKNIYIDSSAKSATSVLVRFFQSIGEKMTKSQKISAYCGMIDDMQKSGFVFLDSSNKVKVNKKLEEDKNAKEIYDYLDFELTGEEKENVIKHLDVFSSLTQDEIKFRKNLYNRIQLNGNSKMAYVVINPDDEEWYRLGGDTNTTSEILRDFRTRTLAHKKADEFLDEDKIERLKDVEMTAVFYPDYKTKRYRISIHSNKDYAEKMIEYNRNHYCKNLTAGGHKNRAGGSTAGLDKKKCGNWTDNFIRASEKISYPS